MPLFRRADGVLVDDASPGRLMMPHVSWGRTASAVFHEALFDLTKTEPWLVAFNAARAPAAERVTLFHLFLWSCARALHRHPELNRFVSGGRLYQRTEVLVALTAKRAMTLDAPVVTVKARFPDAEESLGAGADRVAALVREGRTGNRSIDKELALGARLPHLVVRAALTGYRVLDRFNLLPASLIESDPSYSSLFVANLGSVGLDRTYHHLFDLGTCSLFAAVGTRALRPVVRSDGELEVRPTLEVRWTFDERVADGLRCAAGLGAVREAVEDPEAAVGGADPATVEARSRA